MNGDFIGVLVYTAGLLGWYGIWHYIVGYGLLSKLRLLHIPFWGAQFVFIVNIVLAFFASINTYAVELQLYPYVEANAKTVALLSLAIAVFVVIRISSGTLSESAPLVKIFLWLIFWAFLISLLGCLPLYWMPAGKYWLTTLRHIKSVPLFYSIFILAAGIIVFIYETGYKHVICKEVEVCTIRERK